MKKNNKKKLYSALNKKALGFTATEQNEEYQLVEGDMVLVKKKVSVKEVPPETSAIKMLLEEKDDDFDSMSIAELESEKRRLLQELGRQEKLNKNK